MFGLSYLELSILLNAIAAVCFAFVLLLINIPRTEYSKKLAKSKNLIALTFLASAWVFIFTLQQGPHGRNLEDFQLFSEMMILVVTAVSTASLSYALISLLDDKAMNFEVFLLAMGFVAAYSIVLARVIMAGESQLRWILIFAIILGQIVQCVIHTIFFIRVYNRSRKSLERYYDEDEDHKLRWVRFCFTVMMLTEVFVLVYLPLPHGSMTIYALWFFAFMLYFTGNFISFLGSHKLLLDAFAHKALAGGESRAARRQTKAEAIQEKAVSEDGEQREKAFTAIEKSLAKWVEQKKYREYDKSREEIAEQLGTSKELLQLYFTVRIGVDFRTWRTRLRIEDAKQLLLEDKNASTNLIAEMTGFSDRSNFHRQFTKAVGCSPKEWRETDGRTKPV